MDRQLYIAMTGAKHSLQAQHHNNQNLANANTPGFRADLDSFYQAPMYGPGFPTRAYAEELRAGTDFTPGSIMTTDRELDVAIQDQGWFVVQAPDGSEAYTRRGDFRQDAQGLITTGDGHLVMGENGPVSIPPDANIEIADDGVITAIPREAPEAPIEVDRLRLVNPDPTELVKSEDGLIRHYDGEPAQDDAQVRVRSGALEGSNVNMAESLVQMIDHARQFETHIKMLTTAEENEQTSSQLLRHPS
ncbi:flagellar basal-body rod protein FlgF [Halorhodospira halochloris]|uniref:flagellar basal-body rod protein FlgF n=1 Tax=Halorhodospira halochloris TaxID=1052 RepID=UPI001EE931ED|nr:flagellar basal-body rod protein FlgF [Halorhodospira halochloris]MCG5530014.1 flagellar basal-body rod protein FlgF [Halorhodospira halochloris]MCG5548287.1 flagellar basal-body rod protein FlgF [Halorhodospira halochloris]